MLSTATILESFQNLPDRISLDEAVERLIILDRYECAMDDIHEKKGLAHSEVMKEMRQWIQEQK